MMNKRIKKLWVDTLRSDTIKQATGYLCVLEKDSYSFCCLGVLCEIYQSEQKSKRKEQLEINEIKFTKSSTRTIFSYNEEECLLPIVVGEWAGISLNPIVSNRYGKVDSLATLNDKLVSFKEIADLIEEQL